LRAFRRTLGGHESGMQVDNLTSLPWGWPLALETLRRSHFPSPLFPFTSTRSNLAGEPRKFATTTPLRFPLYHSIPAYPDAPAGFIGSPSSRPPPATFLSPPLYLGTPRSAARGHLPAPPSLAYKRSTEHAIEPKPSPATS
jgi:hypothetical protein